MIEFRVRAFPVRQDLSISNLFPYVISYICRTLYPNRVESSSSLGSTRLLLFERPLYLKERSNMSEWVGLGYISTALTLTPEGKPRVGYFNHWNCLSTSLYSYYYRSLLVLHLFYLFNIVSKMNLHIEYNILYFFKKHCVNLTINHRYICFYVSNCCPLHLNFRTKHRAL